MQIEKNCVGRCIDQRTRLFETREERRAIESFAEYPLEPFSSDTSLQRNSSNRIVTERMFNKSEEQSSRLSLRDEQSIEALTSEICRSEED